MDPAQWQTIGDIFSRALELPSEQRHSFVVAACGSDDRLVEEVSHLIAEFEKCGDFLQSPVAYPGQTLSPGDLIADRYRIECLTGTGGMGEVYRVHDELMNETVALKMLRPELSGDELLLRRLHREAQLSRRVTHPNVCRVFDAGFHIVNGRRLPFLTMQYLEGETLAARIRRQGPFDSNDALKIAREMAAGLDAAHQAEIIHRDFKSANVILAGERAVITDFGLARTDVLRPDGSRAGTATIDTHVAGTIAYMSPEQLSGSSLTASSDIYSFGVVLFEILTGRLPFEGANLVQSAMQRVSGGAPDIRTVAPAVDKRWAEAIARCLEPEPSRRFGTAGEIIQHLESPRRDMPWRLVFGVIGTLAGILFLLAVSHFVPRFTYRGPAPGAVIVVTPTNNQTHDSHFDGLTIALTASIGQSSHFNLWDNRRLATALQSMRRAPGSSLTGKDWREVAFRENASLVLFSTLSPIGDGYSLALHAEQIGAAPDPPTRVWDHTIAVGSSTALLDAIHDASTWFRMLAGETPAELSAHNQLARDITSSNWEALELFTQSEKAGNAGRTDEAILLLRRAIAADPQFAMAMMRLGDRLVSQRNSKEGYQFWREAIKEGRSQHLAEVERLNLESRYAMEIGDYAAAEAALVEWSSKFPNDRRPADLLIPDLLYEGKYATAAESGQASAHRFGPGIFAAGQMIHVLGMMNRLDEIPAQIEIIERLGSPGIGLRMRGLLAMARGDTGAAWNYFSQYRVGTQGQESSHGVTLLAHAAADRGEQQRALEILRNGLEDDKRHGWLGLAAIKTSGLAFLEMQGTNHEAAREAALEAVSLESSPEIVSRSISLLARMGFLTDARNLLRHFPEGEGPTFNGQLARSRAEIFLAEGRPAQALEFARLAARVSDASQMERMARIYAAAGQTERSRETWRQFVTAPMSCWLFAEREWPGLCRMARLRNQS